VLGRKLELFLYDTGGDAKQAVAFTKRLLENDKVDILLGGTTTGETMAVYPMVGGGARSRSSRSAAATPIVEPAKKWMFKDAAFRPAWRSRRASIDMQKRGFKNVAVIGRPGAGFRPVLARAQDQGPRAEIYGLTMVADETYAATDKRRSPRS